MKKFVFFSFFCVLCACASYTDDPLPPLHDTAVDSDLLVFKTQDIRVAKITRYAIAYEYDDRHITLAQLGKLSKRFCEGKGRDTVLVDNTTTNRAGFRRAEFECQEHPVLIPAL